MPNLHIRPATTTDLETLYRFEQDLIATERPFNPTIKPDPIHYYDLAAMIASPDIHLLVAEYDGILVGSGYARIEPGRPYLLHPVHAYLGFMYVEPAHRGKDINTRIIQALRQWALSRGITELRLDVYCENTRAIRAYEKAGFIPHLLHMRQPI
jgi:GNAT superfamily N-acetyltransferase